MICSNGQKKRYSSERAAKGARSRRGTKKRLFVYECPFCGGWHQTKMKQHEK